MSGWKKETAQQASDMAQQQFTYQQKLIDQREAERTAAMGQMDSLMSNSPSYQIPGQVQQYTNLMNVLGAQLYGIQDASGGAKSIDAEQFRSQTENVDQWESTAPKFDPKVITPPGKNSSEAKGGNYRQPGDASPTTQGRGNTTVTPPVENERSNNRTPSGRRN